MVRGMYVASNMLRLHLYFAVYLLQLCLRILRSAVMALLVSNNVIVFHCAVHVRSVCACCVCTTVCIMECPVADANALCMCVCIVCLYVCTYVRMYFCLYMYIHMPACIYVYMYGCICMCIYVCMYMCVYICPYRSIEDDVSEYYQNAARNGHPVAQGLTQSFHHSFSLIAYLLILFIHSFIHSFIHLFTHSLTHPLTHSLTHSLLQFPPIFLYTRSLRSDFLSLFSSGVCLYQGWSWESARRQSAPDFARAMQLFRNASQKGHPAAMYWLGDSCFYGVGGVG